MLIVSSILLTFGCQKKEDDKTPKGMSAEMYGYASEISSTVHQFLDGDIKRSDTKDLSDLATKMSDLVQSEYDDGSLDEQYYNDKEVATLCAQTMIYLYSEDSIHEAEDTLDQVDEFLNNK